MDGGLTPDEQAGAQLLRKSSCDCPHPRPVETVPDKLWLCSLCGGWFSMKVSSLAELTQFRDLITKGKQG